MAEYGIVSGSFWRRQSAAGVFLVDVAPQIRQPPALAQDGGGVLGSTVVVVLGHLHNILG